MSENAKVPHGHSIIRGCPCYRREGEDEFCFNKEAIRDVEFIRIDPEILAFDLNSDAHKLQAEKPNGLCFQLLKVNQRTGEIRCISQGEIVHFKLQELKAEELSDAIQMLGGGQNSNHSEICSECLYGLLNTFQNENALEAN
ncbi:MAG: hypothetical protein ACFFD3_16760 [Candidatus Thorarchaeota archaeon]